MNDNMVNTNIKRDTCLIKSSKEKSKFDLYGYT